MLHGIGDRPESFIELLNDFESPARIIALQAPWKTSTGYSWSKTNKRDQSTISEFKSTASLISAEADHISSSRATRGKPTLLGYSQGGVLAYVAATLHPEKFGAALPIASFLPEELYPIVGDRKRPIIRAFHGYDDPVTYAVHSRMSIAKLRTLDYDAKIRIYLGVGHWVGKRMTQDIRSLLKALIERSEESLPECSPCLGEPALPGACSLCDR